MTHTDAYERYHRSTRIDYDAWHDGIGYDLGGQFAAMTPTERDAIAAETLAKQSLDWRNMELLAAHRGRASLERSSPASSTSRSPCAATPCVS